MENLSLLPENVHITVSDISEGMIRDIRRNLGNDKRFSYETFDCHTIPAQAKTYDIIIANHLLFYCLLLLRNAMVLKLHKEVLPSKDCLIA